MPTPLAYLYLTVKVGSQWGWFGDFPQKRANIFFLKQLLTQSVGFKKDTKKLFKKPFPCIQSLQSSSGKKEKSNRFFYRGQKELF
jgi:hypothetical protein